jgi:hypothetical protein
LPLQNDIWHAPRQIAPISLLLFDFDCAPCQIRFKKLINGRMNEWKHDTKRSIQWKAATRSFNVNGNLHCWFISWSVILNSMHFRVNLPLLIIEELKMNCYERWMNEEVFYWLKVFWFIFANISHKYNYFVWCNFNLKLFIEEIRYIFSLADEDLSWPKH